MAECIARRKQRVYLTRDMILKHLWLPKPPEDQQPPSPPPLPTTPPKRHFWRKAGNPGEDSSTECSSRVSGAESNTYASIKDDNMENLDLDGCEGPEAGDTRKKDDSLPKGYFHPAASESDLLPLCHFDKPGIATVELNPKVWANVAATSIKDVDDGNQRPVQTGIEVRLLKEQNLKSKKLPDDYLHPIASRQDRQRQCYKPCISHLPSLGKHAEHRVLLANDAAASDYLHPIPSKRDLLHHQEQTDTAAAMPNDYLHPVSSKRGILLHQQQGRVAREGLSKPLCVDASPTSMSDDYLHPVVSKRGTLHSKKQQDEKLSTVRYGEPVTRGTATTQTGDYLHPVPTKQDVRHHQKQAKLEGVSASRYSRLTIASASIDLSEDVIPPLPTRKEPASLVIEKLGPTRQVQGRPQKSDDDAPVERSVKSLMPPQSAPGPVASASLDGTLYAKSTKGTIKPLSTEQARSKDAFCTTNGEGGGSNRIPFQDENNSTPTNTLCRNPFPDNPAMLSVDNLSPSHSGYVSHTSMEGLPVGSVDTLIPGEKDGATAAENNGAPTDPHCSILLRESASLHPSVHLVRAKKATSVNRKMLKLIGRFEKQQELYVNDSLQPEESKRTTRLSRRPKLPPKPLRFEN